MNDICQYLFSLTTHQIEELILRQQGQKFGIKLMEG